MTRLADKTAVAFMRAADAIAHRAKQTLGAPGADEDRSEIKVTYRLEAGVGPVWRALTDPALLRVWTFKNDFRPDEGRASEFRTTAALGFDGIIRCKVVRVVPLRELIYEWNSGPASTTVYWTLEPDSDDVTRLNLSQRGFRPEDGWIYEILKKGWSVRSRELLTKTVAGI